MSTLGFREGRRRKDVNLNVTSLIDVLFLLIIFFMLTGTFKRVGEMELKLPDSSTSELAANSSPEADLEIVATEDGRILLDGAAIGAEELGAKLKEIRAEAPERRVILKAETDVVHGRVVALLDAVRKAGFAGVSIGTEVHPLSGPTSVERTPDDRLPAQPVPIER